MIDMYAGEYSALLSAYLKVRQWKTLWGGRKRRQNQTKGHRVPPERVVGKERGKEIF